MTTRATRSGVLAEDEGRAAAVAAVLAPVLGERLTDNASVRFAHGRGEGFHAPMPPDLVAFPQSTVEVSAVVAACARHELPIIAWGAGTSLEGGVTAPRGGLCLDLSNMNRIVAVNPEDLDCTVEAGVTREDLNTHLRDTGLFFPIDPGANATLGGMAATRASGTTAVRYGTMRDNVLSLRVVLADGRVVRTTGRARKSSAGYDLTRLFVGSEGTLGVITEVTLRLSGLPETVVAAVCPFDDLAGAVGCVIETMQTGVPLARIELLDAVQIGACNAYSRTELPETPTLFLEFHGAPRAVEEQVGTFAEIAARHGAGAVSRATRPEDRSRLWRARHNAYHAAQALRPGTSLVVSDVCVPISRLADCVLATHADIAEAGMVAPIVGHVGDGNFHVMFTVDGSDPVEVSRVRLLNDRLVDRALAMDGTCTGEHGIGAGKREKLIAELGGEAVGLMLAVKRAFDPQGLLNPDKIFLPSEDPL
ncbi:MAG: FAD-binding protein [Proteobacteria bacterium]|nr:FAD-binding protein [Pseudomonadota bacterium]